MRKLGINADIFEQRNALDNIPLLRAAGFESTFICHKTDKQTGAVADAAAKHGVALETLHAPFDRINDMWLPGEGGERMLGALTDCADACAHYGVPVMIVHISSGIHAPHVNDLGHARFDRLVEHAAKAGVTVAFENQRKLANIAFLFELYADCENIGFCWDCGHEQCFAGGREYMPLFGDRTAALHVHDNCCKAGCDDHLLPFDGAIDYARFAEHLRKSGYTGTLMLETFPEHNHRYDNLSHEAFFALAYEKAAKLRTLADGE